MWRSKKFIIIAVVAVLLLGATLGGVAMAQGNDEESSQPTAGHTAFLDKVAEIYEKNTGVAIDSEELQKAFIDAGQELQKDARDAFIDKMVEDGKMTQDQADAYKAWLDDRPAFPTEEFKQWMEEMPDIPGLTGRDNRIGPFGGMQRGPDMFGQGFGGMFGSKFGGKFGWCPPEASEEE